MRRKKRLFVSILILIFVLNCSCSYKNPEEKVPAPVEKTDSEGAAATSAPENKIPEEINTVSENTGDKKNEAEAELSTAPTPVITNPEEPEEISVTPVPTNGPSDAPALTKPAEEVTPGLTETAKKNTPTKKPTQVTTVSKVPTKAPTKIPTKAPTKAPTKVPTKAPTKAPTEIPEKVCEHKNCELIWVETVYPEEGHWEEQEAWDEPVYVGGAVCRCGVTELDFAEDGRTTSKATATAFLEHTRLAEHSYGTAYILVDYIHHEATKVWVVDKLQQSSYEAIGAVCYDCGLKKYF